MPVTREVLWGFFIKVWYDSQMKFVTISDVHIKVPGDRASQKFIQFLKTSDVQEADYIFLLGDIFDLLVGNGYQVETRYSDIFKELRSLLEQGKRIVQYEGNHDFHFEGLIKSLLAKWKIESDHWKYEVEPKVHTFNGRKVLFCHGDEIEIGNLSYKFYRLWIRSFFIKLLANYVVPAKWVQAIGDRASRKSRERNNHRYDHEAMNEKVRPLFRESAKLAGLKYQADMVICGHSHCKDDYTGEVHYLNNGYFPNTESYISFDGEKALIKSLPAD